MRLPRILTEESPSFTVLCLCLILIGLLHPLGGFLGSRDLALLGNALAASPAPNPFTGTSYYENFAASRILHVTLTDGGNLSIATDRNTAKLLEGPHKRRVVYYNGLSRAPLLPDTMPENVLRVLICERSVGDIYPGVAREVTLEVRDNNSPDRAWTYTVRCDEIH